MLHGGLLTWVTWPPFFLFLRSIRDAILLRFLSVLDCYSNVQIVIRSVSRF
ncbi:hypothetical protein SynPROSU1_01134 [Synechococcus sp. PROS-U-1]|nr:hypothetical protein SynPROSU1_01134 [Synechococcus sp. PROS-U-1]